MHKAKLLVGAMFICAAGLLAAGGCAPNYAKGESFGVVTNLSNKGIVWQTWEGTIHQDGVKDTYNDKGTLTNAFDFNADDPTVIAKLREAAKSGRRVELTYRKWLLAPLTIDNPIVITSIKDASEGAEPERQAAGDSSGHATAF